MRAASARSKAAKRLARSSLYTSSCSAIATSRVSRSRSSSDLRAGKDNGGLGAGSGISPGVSARAKHRPKRMLGSHFAASVATGYLYARVHLYLIRQKDGA